MAAIALWAVARPLVDSVPASVVLAIVLIGVASWYALRRQKKGAPETVQVTHGVYDAAAPLPPKGPFTVGRLYRVRKTFGDELHGAFREGQLLRYLCWGFVPYDELTCYNFASEQGKRVYWSVYDRDPIDRWTEYFEELKEEPNNSPEATPSTRPPAAPSSSAGAPHL